MKKLKAQNKSLLFNPAYKLKYIITGDFKEQRKAFEEVARKEGSKFKELEIEELELEL